MKSKGRCRSNKNRSKLIAALPSSIHNVVKREGQRRRSRIGNLQIDYRSEDVNQRVVSGL